MQGKNALCGRRGDICRVAQVWYTTNTAPGSTTPATMIHTAAGDAGASRWFALLFARPPSDRAGSGLPGVRVDEACSGAPSRRLLHVSIL